MEEEREAAGGRGKQRKKQFLFLRGNLRIPYWPLYNFDAAAQGYTGNTGGTPST